MRAQKLPDVAHHLLANQIIVTEETHRQQAVGQAGASVETERRQRVAHPVEQGIGSRIAQQSADPGTFGDAGQLSLLQVQALNQQRYLIHPHFQPVAEGAVAEGFTNHRAAKAEQIPCQQRAGGAQMKGGGQPGIGPGKEDGILREPLQGRLRGEGQLLAQ